MDLAKTTHNHVIALIVGAGAVENAWNPVIRALEPHFNFPLTADGANCFLARVVYLLRWFASSSGDFAKKQLRESKELLRKIKEDICKEIRLSQKNGELKTRPEFESIVNLVLPRNNQAFSLMLVTTNWDSVVPDALSRYLSRTMHGELIPLYIHGSKARADSLYLPTEVTKEPYRSHQQDEKIGSLHGDIMSGLAMADRVVLYGLSMSPLDAELGQTMAAGWSNPNLRELSIISPDHELVAHRVNLLLDPRHEVKVKGYSPQNLKNKHGLHHQEVLTNTTNGWTTINHM